VREVGEVAEVMRSPFELMSDIGGVVALLVVGGEFSLLHVGTRALSVGADVHLRLVLTCTKTWLASQG
jgi:hypothetical protein